MTKADRAVKALRDAADAIEALPLALRRTVPLFGGFHIQPDKLREEADWIENVTAGVKAGLEEEGEHGNHSVN